MFRVYKFKDYVGVPPSEFGKPLKSVVKSILRSKYEGYIDKEIGLIVAILNVEVNPEGYVLPGEGSTYHEVTFEALAFKPLPREVVEGPVKEDTQFGLFVEIGPVDGMVHRSQIADDIFDYDPATGVMRGRTTKLEIKRDDVVRARITQISYQKGLRVGLSMRHPYLGKLEWIEKRVKGHG